MSRRRYFIQCHRNSRPSGLIDPQDAGRTIRIYDGGVLLGGVKAASDGSWTRTVSLPATPGAQTITADATDASGNVGHSNAITFQFDNTPPTLTINGSDHIIHQLTERIAGTIDAADAGLEVSIYDGATLVASTTSTARGAWSAVVTLPDVQGAHSITAQATDGLGDIGTSAPQIQTYDTVAPVVTITSPGGAVISPRETISGQIDQQDAGRTIEIYDGNTLLGGVKPAADGSWSRVVTLPDLSGAYTITAQATDASGNVGHSNAVVFDLTVAPASGATGAALFSSAPPDLTGSSSTLLEDHHGVLWMT